uniref:KIAA1143 n=1 Tax=Latimeria chalumnae TaxID=7897 RepID=H3B1A7_LATCH
MSKKNQVSYVKPAEPAFLAKFKKDVGYKEGPTVETKQTFFVFLFLAGGGGSQKRERISEILEIKKTLLSILVKYINIKECTAEEEPAPADGKIVFKKPTKRSADDKFSGLTASSSKKKRDKEKKDRWDSRDTENKQKQVKNSSLLSFGDDEEED